MRNRFRKWTLQNLIDAVNDKLMERYGKTVSKKTVQDALKYMKEELPKPAPIEKRKEGAITYFYYSDPDYSIKNLPVDAEEIDFLKDAIHILRQVNDFKILNEVDAIINKLHNTVNTNVEGGSTIVQLEKHTTALGTGYIDKIFDAIKGKTALRITYQSFKALVPEQCVFHPYLLKEYRNRWFVIGRKENTASVTILALDRIREVKNSGEEYIQNDLYGGHNHAGDFVIINTGKLSDKLQLPDVLQDSTQWPFPDYAFDEPGYVLMQTEKLTPYLEAAEAMYEEEDNNGNIYIELRFTRPRREYNKEVTAEEYLETVTDSREAALVMGWQTFSRVGDKQTALEQARMGHEYLLEQQKSFGQKKFDEIPVETFYRWQSGLHIVASIYAWNNLFDEAYALESYFLYVEATREILHDQIGYYLELLMAKGREKHLEEIFSDMVLRRPFLHHYEVYVSLFMDDTFPLTNTMKSVPIFNPTNKAKQLYN